MVQELYFLWGGQVKICFSLIIVQCVYFPVLCVLRLETLTAYFLHLFNYFASGKVFSQNQPTREFVAISKHNNQDANYHELFTTVIPPHPPFFPSSAFSVY